MRQCDEIRRRFAEEVSQPEDTITLDRAALLIAAEEYPTLDIAHYLGRLDQWAAEGGARIRGTDEPYRIVTELNHFLFDELGLQGNKQGYYDPKNSFLNDVMDRRRGIPITLSLIYIAIGRRLSLPIAGIGLPGHFLAAFQTQDEPIYIDAFNQGDLLTVETCRKKVEEIYQGQMEFRPEHLAPVSTKQILIRMLQNLKGFYVRTHNLLKAIAVIDRILLLSPWAHEEKRDRGILRVHLQELGPALTDLEEYLAVGPRGDEIEELRKQVAALKGRLASFN